MHARAAKVGGKEAPPPSTTNQTFKSPLTSKTKHKKWEQTYSATPVHTFGSLVAALTFRCWCDGGVVGLEDKRACLKLSWQFVKKGTAHLQRHVKDRHGCVRRDDRRSILGLTCDHPSAHTAVVQGELGNGAGWGILRQY